MTLHVGMAAPYYVDVVVPASAEFDPMATFSAVTLEITRPKSTASWPCTIISQTAELLVVRHSLADGDLNEAGVYAAWLKCVVPGGVLRTEVGAFKVKTASEV